MIIPWIIAIVLALQCFGFAMARKKSEDTHGVLNFLVQFNVKAGISAFYLIAVIWIGVSLPEHLTTSPALSYMISASLILAGIALPYKLYSSYLNKRDEST